MQHQPHALLERIVCDVGKPEEQADLADRIADHDQQDQPAAPVHEIVRDAVRQMEQPQPRLAGRQQHAQHAKQRVADGIGVDHREDDQPADRLPAQARTGDQVPDQRQPDHRHQFQHQPGEHEWHTLQQSPWFGPRLGRCFDLARLRPSQRIVADDRFVVRRRIPGCIVAICRGKKLQPADRLPQGDAQPVCRDHAAAQCQRNPPGHVGQDVAGNRVGSHHDGPAPQQRHALHRVQRGHRLVAQMVDEGGGGQQHLRAETVRCKRDRHALDRGNRLRRGGWRRGSLRRGSGGGWQGRGMIGRLRLDNGGQSRGKRSPLRRIVQHVQRNTRLIGRDGRRSGLRGRWRSGRLRERGGRRGQDDHH